jgi:hypothetical protein
MKEKFTRSIFMLLEGNLQECLLQFLLHGME